MILPLAGPNRKIIAKCEQLTKFVFVLFFSLIVLELVGSRINFKNAYLKYLNENKLNIEKTFWTFFVKVHCYNPFLKFLQKSLKIEFPKTAFHCRPIAVGKGNKIDRYLVQKALKKFDQSQEGVMSITLSF